MAEYSLATQKIRSGPSSGGLKPQFLPEGGGAIRGVSGQMGSVNPGAARIDFQKAPIPRMVEDMTSKAMQNFMGETANAAFKYAEREAAYLANEAGLKYDEALSRAFSGYEDEQGNFHPGYTHTEGAQAIGSYQSFKTTAEKEMQAMLDNLSPRAKQRAILQMTSAKQQYMNKAATHRVTQMQKAEEAQRLQRRDALTAKLIENPGILLPDPKTGEPQIYDKVTGQTFVAKYFALYSDPAKAKEDFSKTLRQVTEGIFFNGSGDGTDPEVSLAAAQNARQFLERTRSVYQHSGLIGIQEFTAAQNFIRTQEVRETEAANSKILKDIRLQEHQTKASREAVYAALVSKLGTPEQVELDELNWLIETRAVEVEKGLSLKEQLFGKVIDSAPINRTHYMRLAIRNGKIDEATGTLLISVPKDWNDKSKGYRVLPYEDAVKQDHHLLRDADARKRLDAYAEARLDDKFELVTAAREIIEQNQQKADIGGLIMDQGERNEELDRVEDFVMRGIDAGVIYDRETMKKEISKGNFTGGNKPSLDRLKLGPGIRFGSNFYGHPRERAEAEAWMIKERNAFIAKQAELRRRGKAMSPADVYEFEQFAASVKAYMDAFDNGDTYE